MYMYYVSGILGSEEEKAMDIGIQKDVPRSELRRRITLCDLMRSDAWAAWEVMVVQ